MRRFNFVGLWLVTGLFGIIVLAATMDMGLPRWVKFLLVLPSVLAAITAVAIVLYEMVFPKEDE